MTGKASAVISYCLKFPVNSGRSHYLWGVFCGTCQFLKDESFSNHQIIFRFMLPKYKLIQFLCFRSGCTLRCGAKSNYIEPYASNLVWQHYKEHRPRGLLNNAPPSQSISCNFTRNLCCQCLGQHWFKSGHRQAKNEFQRSSGYPKSIT